MIWYRSRGKVFKRDKQQNPTHYISVVQDVTEQKKAGLELVRLKDELTQRATDKYLALFNSIDEGFYLAEVIFDEANRPVDIFYHEENPAAVHILGTSIEGKRLTEVNPDHEPFWCEIFGHVALTGEGRRMVQYSKANSKCFSFYVSRIGDESSRQVAIVFQDITGRKEAEEQLMNFNLMLKQEVEKQTRSLQESATFIEEITKTTPDLITIHDAATNEIIYTNYKEFWKELYNDDEVYQLAEEKRVIALVHPDENEKLESFLRERKNLRDDEVSEVALRMKGEKWVRIRSKVFRRDESGAALQMISFTSDITKAKKAELDLQKNFTILQHAEDMAQMGSWEYEVVTGNFIWSEGMYKIFDLPQGSKVSPETYLDFAPEDRSIAKRIIKNLKKGHQPFEEIIRIKRKDGQRLLKVKGSVVHDESGKVQRLVGVDVDITEIKVAEQKLDESRNLLEQTALASPDAITIYDLAKKQPVYLNNCLAEWVGTTTEDLVNRGIEGRLQMVHADDRLRLLHFIEKMKAAKEGQILTLEYRLHAKNDTIVWIRNRSKAFKRDSDGKLTHILSVLQDVTEEKAAERVLKALNASLEKKNAELESKNEEITSFAFVASHDLREPLRKIHTFSDWLMSRETGLTEPGKQGLEKMNSAVKRLDQLINDILALTKVHAGNEKVKPVDLNALLQQLKEEMQDKIEETGTVIEAETLPKLIGAENQLLYLLKNLISNAIKFQSKETHPLIRIKAEKDDQFVRLSVTDNGIGVSPEYHKKIFEMFRRLHARHEYEGTGMGLAICKKIMEKHGGKITIDSEEGKGATFTCWFPLALFTT